MNKRTVLILAAAAGVVLAVAVVAGAGVVQAGNRTTITWTGYSVESPCTEALLDAGLGADGSGDWVDSTDNASPGDAPECFIDDGYLWGWSSGHWAAISFDYAAEELGLWLYQHNAWNLYDWYSGQGHESISVDPFTDFWFEGIGDIDNLTLSSRGGGAEAEATVAPCPDDRINCHLYDDKIVLYHGADGNSIDFFTVGGDSEGEYLFSVTAADFGDYLDNPPDVPVLIKSDGLFDVYILPTGEVQVNWGPDAEGKSYVIIMSGIDGGSPYGYTLP